MSLTRKFLGALGIEDDKIDEIISAHSDTVNGLKEERDKYKEDAKNYAETKKLYDDVKKSYDELKADLDGSKSPYKTKFENLQKEKDELEKEYADYKKGVEEKEVLAKKNKAYKSLLKEAGVSDKRFDAILKVTDLKSVNIDDEGNIKNADDVKEAIKKDWSDFIVTKKEQGASVSNPAGNSKDGVGKSRATEIAERYKTNLYGKLSKEES